MKYYHNNLLFYITKQLSRFQQIILLRYSDQFGNKHKHK